jgi:hypothetical protein
MTWRANRSWKVGARVLIAAVTALMMVAPVAAQVDEEVRLPFGPVGIANGQTAVLTVTLLALPPNPCRVTLSFYDRDGQLLGTREEPATATFTLEEPNVTTSFELAASQVLREGQVRAEFLPAVQAPPNPCADLVATLEVYDGGGRTSVLVNPGAERGLNPQPEPPSAEQVRLPFGPLGITHGQTAVLNLSLLALPPNPCQLNVSFYDREGQVLGTREEPAMATFTLEEPNVTESFELPAAQALSEGQVRAEILPAVQVPPSTCADLVATLEIYGPGDQTQIYWASPGHSTRPPPVPSIPAP